MSGYPAQTRARVHYEYDSGGRVVNVEHYWDEWVPEPFNPTSGTYTSEAIIGAHYEYDSVKGLRTSATFYKKDPNGTGWVQEWEDEYGYDAQLDYLTSADYGDGLANASVTWTYDAAGNRISDSSNAGTWTYDNLNRMTASPGVSYTNDILGNRLTKGSGTSYAWDVLNRMTSYTSGSATTSYVYRADGMRVSKSSSSGSTVTRYDGQMAMEDVEVAGSNTTVTRQGLGARGLDYVTRTTSSGTTTLFPVYDGHGSNVAMLQRNGSGYTVSERRSYDAWGAVRQGAQTGNSSGRYVAKLGHKQDDESGLVYMRARYYEPSTGRFINEDLAQHGLNWFIYCSNDPTNRVDHNGKMDSWSGFWAAIGFTASMAACALIYGGDIPAALMSARVAILSFTILFLGDAITHGSGFTGIQKVGVGVGKIGLTGLSLSSTGIKIPTWMNGWLAVANENVEKGMRSSAAQAVMATFAYSLAICGALLAMENE